MFSRNQSQNLPVQRRTRMEPWLSFQDEMRDMLDRFNENWGLTEFGGFPSLRGLTSREGQFVPRVDVRDRGNSYLVTAEIPGMTEKDINIGLTDNVLTLEGEKKSEFKDEGRDFYRSEISYGSFYRSIPLNDEVDDNKVEASYKDGMLRITLGKKEGALKKSKKITINTKPQLQQ